MNSNYAPAHLRWEQMFAEKPFPLMANRHAIEGENFARHSHDFMELVLVTSGTGKHLTLYGDETLQVGRGLVLHPGIWHAYHDCKELVIYNCCFRLDLLQREFIWGQDDTTLKALLWPRSPLHEKATLHCLDLTTEQVAHCQSHLESLVALDKQKDFVKVRHLGHFLLFLATFVHPLQQTARNYGKEVIHPAVQQSVQLFEDSLALPWNLPELANSVKLDPSYLVRLFHTNLNMTPMVYLTHKRAERAAALLVQTGLSIREIGQEVGWPDANHFARKFKAQMGVSATQYRAMCMSATTQQDLTHAV